MFCLFGLVCFVFVCLKTRHPKMLSIRAYLNYLFLPMLFYFFNTTKLKKLEATAPIV